MLLFLESLKIIFNLKLFEVSVNQYYCFPNVKQIHSRRTLTEQNQRNAIQRVNNLVLTHQWHQNDMTIYTQ